MMVSLLQFSWNDAGPGITQITPTLGSTTPGTLLIAIVSVVDVVNLVTPDIWQPDSAWLSGPITSDPSGAASTQIWYYPQNPGFPDPPTFFTTNNGGNYSMNIVFGEFDGMPDGTLTFTGAGSGSDDTATASLSIMTPSLIIFGAMNLSTNMGEGWSTPAGFSLIDKTDSGDNVQTVGFWVDAESPGAFSAASSTSDSPGWAANIAAFTTGVGATTVTFPGGGISLHAGVRAVSIRRSATATPARISCAANVRSVAVLASARPTPAVIACSANVSSVTVVIPSVMDALVTPAVLNFVASVSPMAFGAQFVKPPTKTALVNTGVNSAVILPS